MDEMTRNELGIERRVVVSESLELPRMTVQGLCEAIAQSFKGPNKPVRILFTKGENLVIERLVSESELAQDGPFITAFEMVRQHAEVLIMEAEPSPIEQMCRAAQALAERSYDATMFVVHDREHLESWFPGSKIDLVFRIPVVEDLDCPDNVIILCGSQSGKLVSQIEYAVFCRMEAR